MPKILTPIDAPNAVASAAGLILGSDVALYRSAADILKTDDNFQVNQHLAVGIAPNTDIFTYLSSILTDIAGATAYGIYAPFTYRPTNDLTKTNYGFYTQAQMDASNAVGDLTGTLYGSRLRAAYNVGNATPRTLTELRGAMVETASSAGAGPITAARSLYVLGGPFNSAITTYYGIYLPPPSVAGSGSLNNVYGLYIPSYAGVGQSGVAYGIYSAGGAIRFDGQPALGLGILPALGRLQFIAGTTAADGIYFGTDVVLYRSAADILKTDDALHVGSVGSTTPQLRVLPAGASTDAAWIGVGNDRARFGYNGASIIQIDDNGTSKTFVLQLGAVGNTVMQVNATGQLSLPKQGAGTGLLIGGDTNLYRVSADVLKTDDQFQSVGGASQIGFVYAPATAVGMALACYVSGEAQRRFSLAADGRIDWGPGGSTTPDTNLYRNGTDVLKTDDTLAIGSGLVLYPTANGILSINAAANPVLRNFLASGDAQYAFRIGGDGRLEWGDGGASAPDTNLYRDPSGNLLVTDDSLYVKGDLNIDGGAALKSGYNLDMGSGYITGLRDPNLSRPQDAATKNYVDKTASKAFAMAVA